MSNYFVSGIYFNGNNVITHVMVHKDLGNNEFEAGVKMTETSVIRLYDAGNTLQTLTWNYSKAGWYLGEDITVVKLKLSRYLRTHSNNTANDNLDNLINLEGLA